MPNLFSFKKLKLPKKHLLKPKRVLLSGTKQTNSILVKKSLLGKLKFFTAGPGSVQGPTSQKSLNRNKKPFIFAFLVIVLVTTSFAFLIKGTDTEASWYNDNWQYRKPITIENTGSAVTNQQVKVEQDTATLISGGKLQSNCEDIRFTDKNGKLLKHRTRVLGSASVSYVEYTSYGNTAASTSDSFSHTVTSGTNNVLIVTVQAMNSQGGDVPFDISSVTYNGVSMTKAREADMYTTNRNYSSSIWYLANPSTGSNTVQINYSTTVAELVAGAATFSGVDQTTPIGGTADNWGTTTPITATVTTTASNSVVVGGGINRADWGTLSVSTGTQLYVTNSGDTSNTGANGTMGYVSTPTIGSNNFTVASTTFVNQVIAAELIPGGTSLTGDTCNNASTDFYVLMPEINPGDNTIYMYYGNETATTVESQDAFNQTTFTPNSLTTGSQAVTPGPALWYKFDEGVDNTCTGGSNDACDASGQGLNGAESGNVTWQAADMCVKGTSCLFFDGSDDVVTVTNNEPIDFDVGLNSGLTFSAWVKVNSDGEGNTGQIFYKGTNTYLRTTNEGSDGFADLEVKLDLATTDATATATNGVTLNKWHYVAFGYTDDGDDEVSLYIDGKLVATSTNGVGSLATDTNNLLIGGTTTANFHGFIDDVKVRPYQRTAAEIAGDMNGSVISQGNNSWLTSSLAGFWRMDDAGIDSEGEVTPDSSGSGNNGTLYGDNSTGDNGTGMTCTAGGKFGTGCDFDGTDDYVNTGNWNITSDEFAISTWINLDSVASNNRDHLFSKWNASSNDRSYMLAANYGAVSGNIAFGVSDAGSNFMIKTTPSSVVTTDTWYHVVAIYRKGDFEIYVNGVSQSLSTSTSSGAAPTGAPESNSTSVYIGGAQNENGSAQYGDGTVDSTRVYSRALSSKEVRDLYAWAPGPIVHYKMDENSGTTSVYDTSGNSNTATMNGTMTSSDWVPGKYGSALDFDGSNDYLSSANQVTLSSMTYTAWIKTSTAQPAFAGVMSSTSTGGTFAQLQWNGTTNSIRVQIDNGTPQKDYYASQDLEDGLWHHVGFTYDASTESLKLYIDGVEQAVTIVNDDAIGSYSITQYIQVGVERLAGNFFTGVIDDARVYNYALTPKQIINVMNAGEPGDKAVGSPVGHAIGYWKFDEGYGTTAYDNSISGNNGTVTGATWSNSGKYNKALSFDGSGDSVNLTDPSGGELDPTSQLTISAWIYPETDGEANFGRIISEVASVDLYVTNDDNSAVAMCAQTDSVTDTCTDSDSIPLNTWSHVAVVYTDPNSRKFYINGVLNLENDSTNNLANDASSKIIGDRAAGGRSFDGFIDEVKIYNYALTEDEVKLEYNRGSGIVFGSLSTQSDGTTASNSSSREYCVPGDTSACNPPVLEYKFDENTGTTSTYDTSGNGYTGTLTSITSGSWVPGAYGSALQFDGSVDYVSVPGTPLNTSQSTGTISAWVKPLDATDTEGIFSTLENRDRYMFIDGSTFKASMYDGTGATFRILSGGTVDTNWHFISFSWDIGNGSLKFYVDGVLADSYSGSSWTTAGTTSGTYLARSTSANSNMPATDYFEGSIDQFIIYDYVRTPAQIAWEYNKGAPVAWYKFDECEGTTIYDSAVVGKDTAAANDGTLTIGATGTNTDEGSCAGGTSSDAWYNGASGKWGSSISLDGTNDYVTVSSEGSKFSYSNFTYSAWVKQSSDPGSNRFIVDNRDADNDGALLHVLNGSPDKFECQYNSTDTAGTTTVSNDTWYHVVCVADGSNIKIYVNGLLENSSSQSGSISESTNMRIGARSHTSAASYFPGLIDDVRIYNYPLTAEQVKVLYNNGAVRLE